jgi:serine phosphatase RsbU (regulator of sigma subunit)
MNVLARRGGLPEARFDVTLERVRRRLVEIDRRGGCRLGALAAEGARHDDRFTMTGRGERSQGDGGGFISAAQGLAFLDRASEVLARTLDYELTLGEIARLAVPELADWCAVDIAEPDGSLRQITSGYPESELEQLLMELRRRFRVEQGGAAGVAHVISTGEPELWNVTEQPTVSGFEVLPEEAEAYRRLAPRSYLIVPLVTRGRTIGALTLLSTREDRAYGPGDLAFAGHLARRFALAIDNARLFDETRAAHRRASFLVSTGEVLGSSLDYEQTLQNVAHLAVPDLVDWCAVHLVDENGEIVQVAVAHADPEKERFAWELSERYPTDPDAPSGAANVIRTGVTEYVDEITDELIDALVPDAEQRQITKSLGLRAAVTAPLRARDRMFGTITFVTAESGRRLTKSDVELFEEVARRAGTAVENARLYTERTRIAHTLQAELLPKQLPHMPYLDLAVSYRAAGELNEVGGDFYDVFPASDDAWLVVVGDVSGKGAEAAGVTALARYTLHAAALQTPEPSQILDTLNTALLAQRGGHDFCTVCLAAIRPSEGRTQVRIALAGHPPPVLIAADGTTSLLGERGTLLGVFGEPVLADTEVEMRPGDTLLMYTDGVIEAGRPTSLLGEAGLARVLAEQRPETAAEVVEAAAAAAVEAQGGPVRDDMALVALRMSTLVATPAAARDLAPDSA